MDYICKKTCYFKDRLWNPGEKVSFPEDELVPKHFEPVKAKSKARAKKKD